MKHSSEEYRKRKVVPTRLQYEDYYGIDEDTTLENIVSDFVLELIEKKVVNISNGYERELLEDVLYEGIYLWRRRK